MKDNTLCALKYVGFIHEGYNREHTAQIVCTPHSMNKRTLNEPAMKN